MITQIMPTLDDKFIILPHSVIRRTDMTMQEKIFYMEILNLSSLEKGCIASNGHFEKSFGVSKKSASNTIASLVKKGFISSEITNRNHTRILSIKNGHLSTKDGHLSIKSGETKENITVNKTINIKSTQKDPDTKKISENKSDLKAVDLIRFYKENISGKLLKVREPKAARAIVDNKQNIEKMFIGLKNYAIEAKTEDSKFVKNLLSFIEDEIYLDYQEEPKLNTKKQINKNPNGTNTDTFDLSGIDYGTDDEDF